MHSFDFYLNLGQKLMGGKTTNPLLFKLLSDISAITSLPVENTILTFSKDFLKTNSTLDWVAILSRKKHFVALLRGLHTQLKVAQSQDTLVALLTYNAMS